MEHALVRFSTPLTAIVAGIIWPLKWLDRGAGSVQDGGRPLPQTKREWLAPQIDHALSWLTRTEEPEDLCKEKRVS